MAATLRLDGASVRVHGAARAGVVAAGLGSATRYGLRQARLHQFLGIALARGAHLLRFASSTDSTASRSSASRRSSLCDRSSPALASRVIRPMSACSASSFSMRALSALPASRWTHGTASAPDKVCATGTSAIRDTSAPSPKRSVRNEKRGNRARSAARRRPQTARPTRLRAAEASRQSRLRRGARRSEGSQVGRQRDRRPCSGLATQSGVTWAAARRRCSLLVAWRLRFS
jgi:hypothetical protein